MAMPGRLVVSLLIISFVISVMTSITINNTVGDRDLSDARRYIEGYKSPGSNLFVSLVGGDVIQFTIRSNIIFSFLIGWLIFDATKSWRAVFLALLGFSMSLVMYSNLVAQAIVMIIALWLWMKVDAHGWKNILVYIAAGLVMYLTHSYGALLAAAVFAIKHHDWPDLRKLAILIYALGAIAVFFGMALPSFQGITYRMSFYHYFILPMSLGGFDFLYWYGLFGLILMMVLEAKDNKRETMMFIGVLAIAIPMFIMNFEGSVAQLNFFRMLLFAELTGVALIGKNFTGLASWLPWMLIALGAERLIVGTLI